MGCTVKGPSPCSRSVCEASPESESSSILICCAWTPNIGAKFAASEYFANATVTYDTLSENPQ